MNNTINIADSINVDKITRGYVIDHIKAGYGMRIYKQLKLDELSDCSIALIQNVKSKKFGKKDLIKIQGSIKVDMNVLGYIDPNITVITIENNKIKSKESLTLPQKLTGVIACKNPRCITSVETGLTEEFTLSGNKKYRCVYCEQEFR